MIAREIVLKEIVRLALAVGMSQPAAEALAAECRDNPGKASRVLGLAPRLQTITLDTTCPNGGNP